MFRQRARKLPALAVPLTAALCLASLGACSNRTVQVYKPGTKDTIGGPVVPASMRVRGGRQFPAERCAKNREFGPITYLTNAQYTASAGVIEVLLAKAKGYFDQLCLDVVVTPSFSSENYEIVASNEAQFATAGSFSEMVDFSGRNNAKFVAVAVVGREPLDTLILRPGQANRPEDLRGATIGVQGAVTPAVATMLARAGLQEVGPDGVVVKSYQEQLQTDLDPLVRLADPAVVGITGARSDDLIRLAAAKALFHTLDPASTKVPGSFGVLYTNATFTLDYPTIVEDFIRAAARARDEALANPAEAVAAMAAALPADVADFDADRETARWKAEAAIIEGSPVKVPPGIPMRSLLDAEVRAGVDTGLFGGIVPIVTDLVDDRPSRAVYAPDNQLIWPAPAGTR